MHWNPAIDGFEFKAHINFSPKIRKQGVKQTLGVKVEKVDGF